MLCISASFSFHLFDNVSYVHIKFFSLFVIKEEREKRKKCKEDQIKRRLKNHETCGDIAHRFCVDVDNLMGNNN